MSTMLKEKKPSLMETYPFPTSRPGTEDALEKVDNAFDSGKRFVLIDAPTGCHAAGTEIIMHNGHLKKVEEIEVGDNLMGPDNESREVQHLCRGRDTMYKIIPLRGGDPFIVNGDHILSLRSTNERSTAARQHRRGTPKTGNEYINISVNDYLKCSKTFKHMWKLYRVAIDNWNNEEGLEIDPYFLGLMLGDGSMKKGVGLTTMDIEIEDELRKQAAQHGLGVRVETKKDNVASTYYATAGIQGPSGRNELINKLRQVNLFGRGAGDKFIPYAYKLSNKESRLEILAGLMDSDGSMGGNCFDFCVKSRPLCEDTAFVARSLGLQVTSSVKVVNGTEYFRINISGHTDVIPCRLSRKQAKPRSQKKNPMVTGFKIEKLGTDDYYGFHLDKDHLYLLSDFCVTHNSGKSGLAVAFARRENSVILTPTKLLQKQYAETDVFDKEYSIFGKSNYNCGLPGLTHMTVDQAVCVSDKVTHESRNLIKIDDLPKEQKGCASALKDKCVEAETCEYYKKVRSIGKVPGAIANYDLVYRLKKYPGQKWGADLGDTLVMDEAHQLIDKVREIFGFKYSNFAANRLLGPSGKRKKNESPIAWLKRSLTVAQTKFHMEKDAKKSARYDNFVKRAGSILQQDIEDEQKFFIEDKGQEIEIKPLDMRFLKGKVFFPFKKIVMLSATFPDNFREVFGIKDEESEVITIPSQFDKAKRPILFAKNLPSLNRSSVLKKGDESMQLLDLILKRHKNHKGIVHTGNYKFMDQLRALYQKDKRFIWVGRDDDKDDMLQKHSDSKEPTVLVSPSMMEGVDLKDDLARFGVTLKVPYPMLDPYTKMMINIYPSWYNSLTATNICQSYGRQVRTENDWAIFYILDGAFWNCISRGKRSYSKYFLEALKVGDLGNLKSKLEREIKS